MRSSNDDDLEVEMHEEEPEEVAKIQNKPRERELEVEEPVDEWEQGSGLLELEDMKESNNGAIAISEEMRYAFTIGITAPQSCLDRTGGSSLVATQLGPRYKQTGIVDDLQRAIRCCEGALRTILRFHSAQPGRLGNLGISPSWKYEYIGAMDDLQQATPYSKKTLEVTTREGRHRAGRLIHLAFVLASRFGQIDAVDDLQQAILYSEEALKLALLGHPNRANCLSFLADQLSLIYKRTGDIGDLQQAVLHSKSTLMETSIGYLDQAKRLTNLASKLNLRYQRTWGIDDIQQAVLYSEEALEVTPQDSPSRANLLNSLATQLGFRSHRTGSMDDLQQAVSYGEEALGITPRGHPHRTIYLASLTNRLILRHKWTGNTHDLQRAIVYSKEALIALPVDHSSRTRRLSNLAALLSLRYEQVGTIDLRRAILYDEKALAETPQGHLDRADYSANMVDYFYLRYEQTRDMNDLQQAIFYGIEALIVTAHGQPSPVVYLANLPDLLKLRYEQTGAMDDLQQAILYSEKALAVMPQGHPCQVGCLNNLCDELGLRYERTGVMDDLQQAIMYGKKALAAMSQNHLHRTHLLQGVVHQHSLRYGQIGDTKDLQQAIAYREVILVTMPESHPDRASHLINLANQLRVRHEWTGSTDDLQQAIRYGEEALAITPQDHPNRSGRLNNLAFMLLLRFQSTDASTKDFLNSILYLQESCGSSASPTFSRVAAARLFSYAFYQLYQKSKSSVVYEDFLRKTLQKSAPILEDAVLLLPKVSPQSLERQDQQYNLSRLNGLAADAASLTLEAGKTAYEALKLLELSRGIMMGFAIDCRNDLSDLQGTDIHLFHKFNSLRMEIDTPLSEVGKSSDFVSAPLSKTVHHRYRIYESEKQRRDKAIYKMEEAIEEIRKLPGHERFHLPPSSDDLISMARNGPIVTFVSTPCRSDAIIVTSSAITSIPLPKLLFDGILGRVGEISGLAQGTLRTYESRNKRMQELLLWLWDVAVEPVVQELQLTARPNLKDSTKLPHIWWIGVGPLSMAPFHAAGDYSPKSGPHKKISSYAISSYAPTIKALSYAREKDLSLRGGNQLLLVTMPTTPGQSDLPDVDEEVKRIAGTTKGWISTEHLSQPSAEDVLDRLQSGSYHAVHFACHGISDDKDPSNSHLVLLKGDTVDRLTVQDISRRNTKTAQLAYLSACSTANNPATNLADEIIHIASGFQLAGFSHVLATMWAANSKVCKEISVDFYGSLFDDSNSGEGHQKVAVAFHNAVKKARDKSPNQPLKWAPFIHMGA